MYKHVDRYSDKESDVLYRALNSNRTRFIRSSCPNATCGVLITNEVHNSYNQFFLFHIFRMNLVVHHQEHGIIYCITQFWYNHAGKSSCYEVVGKTVLPTTS